MTKTEAYKLAIETAQRDTENLWQTFSVFWLAESLVLGFALTALSGHDSAPGWHGSIFIAGCVNLLLCLPWYLTHARATTVRDLRIHQALDLEEDPSRLIRDGAALVAGVPVHAGGRDFRLPRWRGSNVNWLNILILALALTDLALAVWTGPWNR